MSNPEAGRCRPSAKAVSGSILRHNVHIRTRGFAGTALLRPPHHRHEDNGDVAKYLRFRHRKLHPIQGFPFLLTQVPPTHGHLRARVSPFSVESDLGCHLSRSGTTWNLAEGDPPGYRTVSLGPSDQEEEGQWPSLFIKLIPS